MQESIPINMPAELIQKMELVTLQPISHGEKAQMLDQSRDDIAGVFQKFLVEKKISEGSLTVIDGFIFVFSGPEYGAAFCHKMPKALAKNREMFWVRWNFLLGEFLYKQSIG